MLEEYDRAFIGKVLIPVKEYIPCPTIYDRNWWDSLPEKTKDEITFTGESHVEYQWPLLTAERYMDFGRSGNILKTPLDKICPLITGRIDHEIATRMNFHRLTQIYLPTDVGLRETRRSRYQR